MENVKIITQTELFNSKILLQHTKLHQNKNLQQNRVNCKIQAFNHTFLKQHCLFTSLKLLVTQIKLFFIQHSPFIQKNLKIY